jgi:hypothetical protein
MIFIEKLAIHSGVMAYHEKKDVDNEVLFSYLMAASLYHHIIYTYINGTHYESRQPIFCGQYPSL